MVIAILLLGDMGWGDHMDGWGAGWWILMAPMMLVFWGLVIAGVVWVARSMPSGRNGHDAPTAIEVLEHRLASGEISPEEYHQLRATLGGKAADDQAP